PDRSRATETTPTSLPPLSTALLAHGSPPPPPKSSPAIVDNGATITILKDKHLFDNLIETKPNFVTTADSKAPPLKSLGIGSATLVRFKNGTSLTITNAKYCPTAAANLITTNDFEQQGYYFNSIDLKPGTICKLPSTGNWSHKDPIFVECTKRHGLQWLALAAIGYHN
ncbi:hypothetical protein HDU76_006808, partial [Blyttiomyces sp. JEL0837]